MKSGENGTRKEWNQVVEVKLESCLNFLPHSFSFFLYSFSIHSLFFLFLPLSLWSSSTDLYSYELHNTTYINFSRFLIINYPSKKSFLVSSFLFFPSIPFSLRPFLSSLLPSFMPSFFHSWFLTHFASGDNIGERERERGREKWNESEKQTARGRESWVWIHASFLSPSLKINVLSFFFFHSHFTLCLIPPLFFLWKNSYVSLTFFLSFESWSSIIHTHQKVRGEK